MDLFSRLEPPCSDCHQLDEKPINPGIHYCWGFMMWRRADERVSGCTYRDQPRTSRSPPRRLINRSTVTGPGRDQSNLSEGVRR